MRKFDRKQYAIIMVLLLVSLYVIVTFDLLKAMPIFVNIVIVIGWVCLYFMAIAGRLRDMGKPAHNIAFLRIIPFYAIYLAFAPSKSE